MSENPHTTSNGHHIEHPIEQLNADSYREMLANQFGINGETPEERVVQLKNLSQEGTAILLENVNALAQGSVDSLMNHDGATRIGDTSTIDPADRYNVFTNLLESIKSAPEDINPARIGDALAMGIVLLHPFYDGNGRTARLIGLTFRSEFDEAGYSSDFNQLIEPRDEARKRGGFMIYGYTPKFPEGFDQTNPEAVSEYLSGLVQNEEAAYIGPFEPAPLHVESVSANEGNGDKQDAIVESYEDFRQSVAEIRNNMDGAHYIGAGKHSDVFKLTQGDTEYAARFIKQMDIRTEVLHSHIVAGARAEGIPGLEKIVAASYEDGVLISEFVPGRHLQTLTLEQITKIPDSQLDALVEARMQALQRDIYFDDHPANILYDTERGFTDIDYHAKNKPQNKTVSRLEAMKTVLGSLDLTEAELYEADVDKQTNYRELKTALHRRVNKYMKETFDEEEYKELWGQFVFVVGRRVGVHRTNTEQTQTETV